MWITLAKDKRFHHTNLSQRKVNTLVRLAEASFPPRAIEAFKVAPKIPPRTKRIRPYLIDCNTNQLDQVDNKWASG